MPAAVYVRVATEEQRKRQSIRTQREFADRYCEFHKLAVFRVYADEGVSETLAMESRLDGRQILRDTRLVVNAVDEPEKLGFRVRSMVP
jgi:site-specific DNA recombinase